MFSPSMSPRTAVWISFVLPGLAHVSLGHAKRAGLAFVSCVAMFAIGAAMLGPRLWHFEFSSGSGFVPIGLSLLPDSFNFGPTLVAWLLREPWTIDLQRLVRAPVEGEHLWLFLTGASGVLSILWASDAHWLARRNLAQTAAIPPTAPTTPTQVPLPATMAIWSWIVPGSAHARLGQRDKGMLLGACVLVVFVLGMWFSRGHAVDRELLAAWWLGDVLFGSGTLFASLVTAPMHYESVPSEHDLGFALTCVAGLMNLIVMIDAYTIAEERIDPTPVEPLSTPAPTKAPASEVAP
jgi:hypothetical protein